MSGSPRPNGAFGEDLAGFHNVGRLTRLTNATGELRHRYDKMGRETRRVYAIDGAIYRIHSHFDPGDRLIQRGYPGGDRVGTSADPIRYDGAGRLLSVPGLVTDTTYDAAGNVLTMTRANGVVSSYSYSDQRGWLDSLSTLSGATSIQALTYARDEAGQIEAVASTHADESWTPAFAGAGSTPTTPCAGCSPPPTPTPRPTAGPTPTTPSATC